MIVMKLNIIFITLFFVGCSSVPAYIPEKEQLDLTRLPLPDTSLSIPHLSSCTDAEDTTIQIDSTSPLTVLVHGCDSSAGRFRSLAQLYAFHGQQAVCFSYDDRDSLVDSAEKLASAVNQLSEATNNQKISIMGHSMGGLISRKALEDGFKPSNKLRDNNLELITISAPLSGIQAADHCGINALHWLSAGIVPGICWLITGDNWNEITASSDFIQQPEPLLPSVDRYLKIVTNEKHSCRRSDDQGACIESDDVFDVSEQYNSKIDSFPNTTGVQVDAGHVEIVGNKDIVPRKLLTVLQDNGMLAHTPTERKLALEKLLSVLY